MRSVVLEHVERDASLLVEGHNLTVEQRTKRQAFAGMGDLRELRGKVVATAGPNRYGALFLATREL